MCDLGGIRRHTVGRGGASPDTIGEQRQRCGGGVRHILCSQASMSADKRALDELDALFGAVPAKAISVSRHAKKPRSGEATVEPVSGRRERGEATNCSINVAYTTRTGLISTARLLHNRKGVGAEKGSVETISNRAFPIRGYRLWHGTFSVVYSLQTRFERRPRGCGILRDLLPLLCSS